ncbi:hypothetical protein SDC9_95078 [bioreactor metagenome]|uniref:Uncharacterized protein n=1 Tax=bioreactor metagenome TaxID=1076179 RepID=A0A645AF99_9ZZZZ
MALGSTLCSLAIRAMNTTKRPKRSRSEKWVSVTIPLNKGICRNPFWIVTLESKGFSKDWPESAEPASPVYTNSLSTAMPALVPPTVTRFSCNRNLRAPATLVPPHSRRYEDWSPPAMNKASALRMILSTLSLSALSLESITKVRTEFTETPKDEKR